MVTNSSKLSSLLNERTAYADLQYEAPFTKEFIDQKAKQGDPLADNLVAQMDADGTLQGEWRNLIDVVVAEAKTRGGIYQEFIDFSYKVPDWVDFKDMEPSQRMVFTKLPSTGLTGLITFIGGSFIPTGLSAAAASQLVLQGQPRLIESGIFILKPALGMKPGSMAHYELIRVRIIHAAIRFFMGKKRGSHVGDHLLQEDEYVNQSQMAFFLTSFSFIHLRTATLMGMKLTDEQIHSHHHRWQYMGYLMGIDADLLTDTLYEEKKLAMAELKRETNPNISDTFFLEMIKKMSYGLAGNKSEEAKEKQFLEFKAILLHAIGEDFIGGWGISMSDEGMQQALEKAQRKIAIIDFIQRIKPIEMLQHYIVKKMFIKSEKKIAVNALGDMAKKKRSKGPMLQKFDKVIEDMKVSS